MKAARGDAGTERESVVVPVVGCASALTWFGEACGVRAADGIDAPNPVLLLTAVTISSDGIGTKTLPALGRLKNIIRKNIILEKKVI